MKLHSVELDVKPRHVIFCIPHWHGAILNLQPDPQAQVNALLGAEQPC